jgi:ribosomal-protein-alanine N-acetyltransferase
VISDGAEIASNPPPEGKETATPRGFAAFTSRLRQVFGRDGSKKSPSFKRDIYGFAGFWIMADEAHITSIAVREKYRRQGIGELMLIALIELATELKASLVTLEVRASNYGAQKLYSKYGFIEVGVRRSYYTDNGEDAILMTVDKIDTPPVQANLERLKQAHAKNWSLKPDDYQIKRPASAPPCSR